MRYNLRPSLSVLSLLPALLIPSILVLRAVHSHPAAAPDRVSSGDTRQRPSSVGGDAGTRTAAAATLSEPEGAAATRIRQKYGLLPLSFEANRGTSTADAPALADLYVRGGNNAGTNYGTATQLVVRLASQAKDTYETYVKFDAGQQCTVSAVKLRLYGQLSGSGTLPVAVYAVPSTTWTETGTNWNNKPAAGTLLRTNNLSGTTARWYEWDVTDYVRAELAAGRSVVAFVLKSTATTSYQATFNSRQPAGANAPRLAITTP
jgi:hypothetical protein